MQEGFSRAWDNQSNRIVHVRELPKKTRNGAKCDCICVEPDCKGPLEACQGDVRTTWYFRHQNKTDCKGGPMTALHILAQELLSANQRIKIKGGEVSYLNAIKEWPIPDSRYKADVVGLKEDGTNFLIEIFVTHKLQDEEEKVKLIRKQEIHSIEIDLSKVDLEISRENLLNLLLTDVSKQRIIYSPKIELSKVADQPKSENNDNGLSWFEGLLIAAFLLWVWSRIKRLIFGVRSR